MTSGPWVAELRANFRLKCARHLTDSAYCHDSGLVARIEDQLARPHQYWTHWGFHMRYWHRRITVEEEETSRLGSLCYVLLRWMPTRIVLVVAVVQGFAARKP